MKDIIISVFILMAIPATSLILRGYKIMSNNDKYFELQTHYPRMTKQVFDLINKYNGDIDQKIIYSLIQQESEFNPLAVGRANEKGLMQIHPVHKLKNGFDVETNIKFGCALLNQHYKTTGSIKKALMKYNAGPRKEIYAEQIIGRAYD